MSFVTKRERVFKDDIDLYDLPPRNEGKLKAYSSCTDARAWSHFYSDQNEHLVDIIKRNNTTCAPKYVPTNVIVDTIMIQKNCEISRLRRKIDTMDQMLAVYDQLELDCGQKCEIAKAHESIKAASKELDDVCLDLDLSGFTEGLESDVYETGKSRGDDTEKSMGDMSVYSRVILAPKESKGVQNTQETVDMATVVKDPRIEEMRDEIIFKDAKLNAMQNSMAVMENDVCEPYCVYAHIYTALEKIYGILYQNDTYKQYLELLSAGRDTRCLDIKGRILFKMKILEKFALALMAPCSHKFANEVEKENVDCDCGGNANTVARVETAYALTSSEANPITTSDSMRAHLVAEIMDSEEMKEILERDPYSSDGLDTSNPYCGLTCYSIDAENVKRLKDLQKSYDDLMECFENLKHEKECLQVRCRKYNELEMEVETLRDQLASCNALWSEKERFRKRSADLEDVNEKFLILQNVTGNLESEIKAEREINNNKTQLIEDLRNENLILERKLSDAIITFEREKSTLLCKLKEFECALSCKDQEVQSLAEQFQKHFEDNQGRDSIKTFSLINEIESLREELLNTKSLLDCCEDEKQHIKEEFQNKLSLINDLRMDFEDLKGNYENLLTKNIYTKEENERLKDEVEDKSKAISNLMEILSEKSKEINNLFDELENKKQENKQLMSELYDIQNQHDRCKEKFENERKQAQELLESEKRKSKELEDALTSDHQLEILRNANSQRKSESHSSDYDSLRSLLEELRRGNALTEQKIMNRECCPADFTQELERLRNDFSEANEIIKILKNDKKECEMSHKRLVEELHNWKQKFVDLENDNINVVAELNNWKQKYRDLGRESSDYYEESGSSSSKQYQGSNQIKKRPSTSSDKISSQLNSARLSGLGEQAEVKNHSSLDVISTSPRSQVSSLQYETTENGFEFAKVMQNIPMSEIKSVEVKEIIREDKDSKRSSIIDKETTKRITEFQEKTRLLSFNDDILNRVDEYREQGQLMSSDEKTRPRYSDMRQDNDSKRSSIIDQGATKRITGSQEKTRLLSFNDDDLNRVDGYREQELMNFDEKTRPGYSDVRQENDSKRSSTIDLEATKRITESQEKTRLLSFNDDDLNRVDGYREQELMNFDEKTRPGYSDMRQENDSKHSSIIDLEATKRITESQEKTRLSFDDNDSNRVGEYQEHGQLMSSDEKSRPRYSDMRQENDFKRSSIIDPGATKHITGSQSQLMSSDEKTRPQYSDMRQENDSKRSSIIDLEATKRITESQEKTRLSFDDNDSNRVGEYQEHGQLMSSDEKSRPRYSDMRQENDFKRSSIIDPGATKHITGSQSQLMSSDEKTRPQYSDMRQENDSKRSSIIDRGATKRITGSEEKPRSSFDDNDSNRAEEYQEQGQLMSSDEKTRPQYSDRRQENDSKRSSTFDQGATIRITGSQDKTRLSFDDNDSNRVDEYKDQGQLLHFDEKSRTRYSDMRQEYDSKRSSIIDQEATKRITGSQDKTRFSFDDNDSNCVDGYQGQRQLMSSDDKSRPRYSDMRQENNSKRSSIIDQGPTKRITGFQDKTRLSFDDNDLNHVNEQIQLISSDEKTGNRYSELHDQILNVEKDLQRDYVIPKRASFKESTIDIPEFKPTAEWLSYDNNASHDDSELQDLAKSKAIKPVLKNSEQEQLLGTYKNISQRDSDSKTQSKIFNDHEQLFYDESEQQNPTQIFSADDSTLQSNTYYEQSQLSSAMRGSDQQKPGKFSGFEQKFAQSKQDPHEQNRLLSADGKAMHLDLNLNDRIQLQNLEVKLSVLNLDSQERARLLSTNKLDSDRQEKIKHSDDDTSKYISKDQERSLSAEKQAFYRDSNLQDHSLLPNDTEKIHRYDSKFQERVRRSSADLGANISHHDKHTSHDLRPLEQVRSSNAEEKDKDSQHQDTRRFSNSLSDKEISVLQHENNFDKHDKQRDSYNLGVITGDKNIDQTQRDMKDEIKLGVDEKSYKNEIPWKQHKDSDYSSKVKYERRLSFGKAEAEESLNKQRRYSDIRYDNIDITDQQIKDLEEQTDWKQKFEESEREKINKLLTLQEMEKELNYWKEKFCALDKTRNDEEANVKNFLDKVIEEKKQLEEILNSKKVELNVLKENNKLNLEEELKKRSHSYEIILDEKQLIQKQLLGTQQQVAELVLSLEHEKTQLVTLSKLIPDMEEKLDEFKNAFDDISNEKQSLENQLKKKEDDLLEKVTENSALKDELLKLRLNQTKLQATSKENLVKLQSEKDQIQQILDEMEKENNKLIAELEEYRVLTEHLDNIKGDYDDMKRENRSLKDKLISQEKNYDYINSLQADNKELGAMLLEAKEQMVRGLESPERSLYPTIEEITAMKEEQHKNHATIRELKDKQDENENIISGLEVDIMSRDERIAILENHINKLTNEVKNLHRKLEDGISAREELQGQTLQDYDESLKQIEARHSKASHNMRTEIAQLEKEKAVLQEQLFKTRNENEEFLRDKDTYYLSKIADLTNEREIMLTELKKLENTTTGLTTDSISNIQSVRESFSRISSNFEANKSQSAALENKLFIVKNSSEELLSKTYEAKRIAENEKQKIFLEKEEAVKERLNLEMKMREMTKTFEEMRDDDRTTIDNLKKQVQNQQLIIKAMNESTEEHTQKLNEKINALQNLYDNSLIKIRELEKQLKESYRENGETIKTLTTQNEAIEKYNEIIQKNSKEMSQLQEALNAVRTISKEDVEIQTSKIETKDNITESLEELSAKQIKTRSHKQQNDVPELSSRAQESILEKHRSASKDHIAKYTENMTELQIMNANVEPSLDFVKNTYRKHRQDQLSQGPVTHSILSLVEKDTDKYSQPLLDNEESKYGKTNITDSPTTANTSEIIDKAQQNALSSGPSNDEDLFLIYSSSGPMDNEQTTFALPDSSKSRKVNRKEEKILTLTNKTDLEKGFDDSTHRSFPNYDRKESSERKPALVEKKIDGEVRVQISTSDESFALPKKHAQKAITIGSIENAVKSSQSSYNGDVSQQMLLHSSDTDDDKLKRKETQSKSKLSLNEYKPESEDFFDNLSNDQDNHFKLARADDKSIKLKHFNDNNNKVIPVTSEKEDLGLDFILETAKHETQETFDYDTNSLSRSRSDKNFSKKSSRTIPEHSFPAINREQIVSHSVVVPLKEKKVADKEVSINSDSNDLAYENFDQLTAALESCKKDYKKKLEAIKAQYDTNIKRMINEHNEGVTNLQNIHEDIIKDMVKKHESEVENLRTISFEAMKRVEVLEKENKLLKNRLRHSGTDILEQEPIKIDSRLKVRDARLSKTTIESFDVKPRLRHLGPCSCSLDVNVSDTIRNIFEQVDQDQRKLAEITYVKYIAHKMLSGNVDALDSQELAFLHHNVCRHWKVKKNIEDTLRKKIECLETELITKQRHARQHIAELDRRVVEERRRLQEVREAVGYQSVPGVSHDMQPDRDNCDIGCGCAPRNIDAPIKIKKNKQENHGPERRLPKPQQPQNQFDETPTRMRRSLDKSTRSYRK